MTVDFPSLEARYLNSCKKHSVIPNSTIQSWLFKVRMQKLGSEKLEIAVSLDDLKDSDVLPLIEALAASFEAVDVLQGTLCGPSDEQVLRLIRAIGLKLRVVDLRGTNLGNQLLSELCQGGVPCQALKLSSNRIRKLDMSGRFTHLRSLNLDFCTALTTLKHTCFSSMPSLSSLSMCETRIANLWTTSAALSNLPSLTQLRFQNCSCCDDPGPCQAQAPSTRGGSFYHPSPICFERHYREFLIDSLPRLRVLDNSRVAETDRVRAEGVCRARFERLPNKSVVRVLRSRESGANRPELLSRSLCASRLGPVLRRVWKFGERPRPRQLEYHPSEASLMAFGTLDGEVFVVNHESRNAVRRFRSAGEPGRVLGLCWLKNCPSKLIAGSDDGSLKLFDINHKPSNSGALTFKSFEQLTSVHVNSTDDRLVASGCSKDIALYDIGTGNRLQTMSDVHREAINVAKFAHGSPSLFATSSFDRDVKMWDLRQSPLQPCFVASSSRGNVMVCFSPDDLYLLVSAVDNEVKQLSAADGRVIMNVEIDSTGSPHNYTRSYYMNGRDYIISGSCDEHVVRICCAQTGKRLRDVFLEDLDSGNLMFVQSLRSDPFRDFNMSVLAASTRPSSKWEIMKVNMLASADHYAEERSYRDFFLDSYGLGG